MAGVRQDDLAKSVSNLYQQYQKVQKAEEDGTIKRNFALASYQRLGREIDNVSKKLTVGGSRAQTAFRRAETVRAAAQVIIDAENEELANKKKVTEEEEKLSKRRMDIAQHDLQVAMTVSRAGAAHESIKAGGGREASTISETRDVAREFDRLARSEHSSAEAAADYRTEAEHLRISLAKVNREGEHGSGVFGALSRAFSGSGASVAGFDNQMRGLGILSLVGFAQQLITVLDGLAGGFVAVAASAGEAGAAIGGAFVAGVAQALPVIGLLGGSIVPGQGCDGCHEGGAACAPAGIHSGR